MAGPDGKQYIYGYIPIVVAKCGLFIKEKGTDVEGVFRVSGSAKRIKELQAAFDTPPKYGKNFNWDGFTVHDAANVLRRYLNDLPQPLIPHELYADFRNVLATQPVDNATAIKSFKLLITSLPQTNQHLLLYFLDLLAVIAAKCETNLMTARNLAVICQPGIISHPSHSLNPKEFQLSQDVLEFLIIHQENFLFGMGRQNKDAVLPKATPAPVATEQVAGTSASMTPIDTNVRRHARSLSTGESSPSLERRSTTVTTPGVATFADPADALAVAARSSDSGAAGGDIKRSKTVPTKRNRSEVLPSSPFDGSNEMEQRRYSSTTTEPPLTQPISQGTNLSKVDTNKTSSTDTSARGALSTNTASTTMPILGPDSPLPPSPPRSSPSQKNKPNKLVRKKKPVDVATGFRRVE